MNLIKTYGHVYDADRLSAESLIIDLGANRGIFAKEMMDLYDCSIVAFEPSRHLCENYLKKVENEYEKFSFFENAVWSERKELELLDFADQNGGDSGVANSIIPHKRDVRKDGRYVQEKYKVQCLTLNEILEPYDKVDLLKIDIEGSEIEVLTKVPEDLLKKCNQVCVEFHIFSQGEYKVKLTHNDINHIVSKMNNIGFKAVQTNDKHPDILFMRDDK